MNTKPNLLRPLLATLLKLSRSLHVEDLNFTLVGFGLPVCPAQLTGQHFQYHGLMRPFGASLDRSVRAGVIQFQD